MFKWKFEDLEQNSVITMNSALPYIFDNCIDLYIHDSLQIHAPFRPINSHHHWNRFTINDTKFDQIRNITWWRDDAFESSSA